MPWYALVRCGIVVNMSICIPKSNKYLMLLLLNLGFGMQLCIYPLRPMPWYALECGCMRHILFICIPNSNWFSIQILLKHGFGMQVSIYSQGPIS